MTDTGSIDQLPTADCFEWTYSESMSPNPLDVPHQVQGSVKAWKLAVQNKGLQPVGDLQVQVLESGSFGTRGTLFVRGLVRHQREYTPTQLDNRVGDSAPG